MDSFQTCFLVCKKKENDSLIIGLQGRLNEILHTKHSVPYLPHSKCTERFAIAAIDLAKPKTYPPRGMVNQAVPL